MVKYFQFLHFGKISFMTLKKILLLPFVVFLFLVVLLEHGLHLDPRYVPSVLINKPMPVFQLPQLLNSKLQLTDQTFKGKVVLLNVWASWCLTCRLEHPVLMDLAHAQAVPIYGLDYKDDANAARKLLKKLGNPYQAVGFDSNGKAAIDFGVYGTPETFVIDQKGIIRYKQIGAITPQGWQQIIRPLVERLQKNKF